MLTFVYIYIAPWLGVQGGFDFFVRTLPHRAEPVQVDSKSSTWHGYSYFSKFISVFNGAMLLVVGDVPVDSETPVVTL